MHCNHVEHVYIVSTCFTLGISPCLHLNQYNMHDLPSFIINSSDSSSPGKFQHRMESSMRSVSYLFQCWQTIYHSVRTWATEHSFRVGVAGIYLVCFHVTLLHYYSPYCNTECHMNHFTNDVTLLKKTFICDTSTPVFISTKQKRNWTILLLF